MRFAAPYLEPDPYVRRDPALSETVTSLYLDTQDLSFYSRHRDSDPDRFKLRVRRYGNPAAGPAYFELKRKVKSVIVKHRAAVAPSAVGPLLEGTYRDLPAFRSAGERAHLEAFLYLQTAHRAEPSFFTRARREMYVGRDGEDVRMTVDRETCQQPARVPDLVWDDAGWVPVDTRREHGDDGPRVLMELKFNGLAPLWMAELVAGLETPRTAYSKYVSAAFLESEERYHGFDWGAVPAVGH